MDASEQRSKVSDASASDFLRKPKKRRGKSERGQKKEVDAIINKYAEVSGGLFGPPEVTRKSSREDCQNKPALEMGEEFTFDRRYA